MSRLKIERAELESFIPHKDSMLLLSGIVDWTDDFESLTSRAVVDSHNNFIDPILGGVPVWVGFEYMAQTVAALSGLERHLAGNSEPRIGYIMGVRGFTATRETLPPGINLDISVRELFRDGPVVSFNCTISCTEGLVAEGTINAYEPERGDETDPA